MSVENREIGQKVPLSQRLHELGNKAIYGQAEKDILVEQMRLHRGSTLYRSVMALPLTIEAVGRLAQKGVFEAASKVVRVFEKPNSRNRQQPPQTA